MVLSIPLFLFSTLSVPVFLAAPRTNALPTTTKPELLIHGYWCGPGNEMIGTLCIDDIDCACWAHDECYEKYGSFNCACDNDLVIRLKRNSAPVAKAIVAIVSISPCNAPNNFPYVKTCHKCLRLFQKQKCMNVPCGVGMRCRIVPVLVRKATYKNYKC